jgi:hypothetical protein
MGSNPALARNYRLDSERLAKPFAQLVLIREIVSIDLLDFIASDGADS